MTLDRQQAFTGTKEAAPALRSTRCGWKLIWPRR